MPLLIPIATAFIILLGVGGEFDRLRRLLLPLELVSLYSYLHLMVQW
jgi:hypothetical protein